MGCHVLIGRVDVWLVEAGLFDAALEVVRDQQWGGAFEELEGPDMG